MIGRALGLALSSLLASGSVFAQETHVLIIAGLSGEAEFREAFVEWGSGLARAAVTAGVTEEHVTFLAEDPAAAPELIRGRSTAEEIRAAFGRIQSEASPLDRVLLVLIGHGEGARGDSRVSLPGADLNAADYGLLLSGLALSGIAVVNVASASGDFITELTGEGRIVVTATRSAAQRNAPRFGEFFVQAYVGEGSDLDRDGRVSVLEAFEFARQETERYYRDRGLIIPETSLLEDRPDGSGVHTPMENEDVGRLAARFFLQGAEPVVEVSDPVVAARLRELYARQEALEVQLAELGARRGSMDEAAYQAALDPLLIELAEVGQEIRTLEGDAR